MYVWLIFRMCDFSVPKKTSWNNIYWTKNYIYKWKYYEVQELINKSKRMYVIARMETEEIKYVNGMQELAFIGKSSISSSCDNSDNNINNKNG